MFSRLKQAQQAIKTAFTFVVFVGVGASGVAFYLKRQQQLTIQNQTTVYWKIKDTLVSEAPKEPSLQDAWNPLSGNMQLLDLLQAFQAIETDDRVSGLVLDFSAGKNPTRFGFAMAQDIRQALLKLASEKQKRNSDFKTVAITDTFESQVDYYIASACSEIQMEPMGSVPLIGLSSQTTFFKNLFDKLGIQLYAFTAGVYKSFLSPFTRTGWTPEEKENLQTLLTSLNDNMVHDIEQSRQIKNVKKLMDLGPLTAQEAFDAGLITKIDYKRHCTPLPTLATERKGYPVKRLERYCEAIKIERSPGLFSSLPKVGVVHVNGTINRGSRAYGSSRVAKALIEAGANPSIDVVVLRIDSGGGDVVASDTIWEACQAVRTEFNKPVIASLGNTCASGGYYIASACDEIFLLPSTITGSIGVASMRPYIPPTTLEKLGITLDSVFLSKGSQSGDIFSPVSPEHEKRTKSQIAETYKIFKSKVIHGRPKINETNIDSLSEGRIFTGSQALENGLADERGGFLKAIERGLQRVGKQGNYETVIFPPPRFFWQLGQEDNLEMGRLIYAELKMVINEIFAEMDTDLTRIFK